MKQATLEQFTVDSITTNLTYKELGSNEALLYFYGEFVDRSFPPSTIDSPSKKGFGMKEV